MAKNLRPPERLVLEGNLKENFRKFKQQFELYLTATGVEEKEDKIKSSTLLTIIGPDALEVYNTFQWPEDGDNLKVNKILEQFEQYCNPRQM
jgi:translation initiation factor 4G